MFSLALAQSLVSIGEGIWYKLLLMEASWHNSNMFSFIAALFPDFSRILNTWSGALVLLQGLCYCYDGLGPGFGYDIIVVRRGQLPAMSYYQTQLNVPLQEGVYKINLFTFIW